MIIVYNLTELNEALAPYKDKVVVGGFYDGDFPALHPGTLAIAHRCNEIGDVSVMTCHTFRGIEPLVATGSYVVPSFEKEKLVGEWDSIPEKPDILYMQGDDEFFTAFLGGFTFEEALRESDKILDIIETQYGAALETHRPHLRTACLYIWTIRKVDGVSRLWPLDITVTSSKEGYRRLISKWYCEYCGIGYDLIEPVLNPDGLPYSRHPNIACSEVENKLLGQVGPSIDSVNIEIYSANPDKYKATLVDVIKNIDSSFEVSFLGLYNLNDDILVEVHIKITGEGNEKGPVIITRWVKEAV